MNVLTVCTPLIITVIVYMGDWGLAKLDVQSPALTRANTTVEKRIKHLIKELKNSKEMGVCTKKIEDEYQKAVIAKSRLMDVKEAK